MLTESHPYYVQIIMLIKLLCLYLLPILAVSLWSRGATIDKMLSKALSGKHDHHVIVQTAATKTVSPHFIQPQSYIGTVEGSEE